MKENSSNSISEQRQTGKMWLDTFTHEKNNILDYPIDKLIEDLKTQIKAAYSEHEEWIELEKNDPDRFNELEEQANQTGHSIHSQMYGYIQDVFYLEDE